ncbi:Type I Iterative PKS [Purpureocillium takamizusanense]|uniref:Type I Iterative PKS n=1 Tax=Purpureocillium takamizusanense TaxID=2060973 RepID=A0A9Q8QL17_9HYPO|nr:Type I Iterative PKS [Purpureocillium takamizusanense]UNI20497.1 Type I Iterative PKS [Purpureocillium takamizusanense]
MVCDGGYFLDQDVSRWDAPFFSCSVSEARALDPQQRLLLEVAYESLESAGIPIEAIAETDTACFVGGCSEDYRAVISRDAHAAPQYARTGNSLSMLANRVSWFFNLRGPSVTCDTACSSSLAALHLACETIRSESNPTRCALVGGANLILHPDDQCALNALGFLSPDSRCFSFDSRANGYARGEGIGMIVLKHIDDALRDGDPIRAVVRGTGLNSDGRTAGIVLPNAEAQERLIRDTYKLAGLGMSDTQYVELHGTGTKVGDPAEVSAVSKTIAGHGKTVYCGSVKSCIGHTEGAAGIAAVIKCVLCLERGVITPNLNFIKANPRLRLGASGIEIATSTIPWPRCKVRRCSINNFGFGGTNAHAIIDDAYNYLRLRDKLPASMSTKLLHPRESAKIPQSRLFVLSAPEQDAVTRQRLAHADYVEHESRFTRDTLPHLASTLSQRRSIFQWRHAVVASSKDELSVRWRDGSVKPLKAGACPNVAFAFTGQGAQWYAMGRELVSYPVFASSLRQSATCLTGMGCSWDAWDELMAGEGESNVNKAEYSQPLCLALQIALVDLARQWGVKPSAVVGHSSGEIAAAYAASALSREDCLKVAYHRGLASNMAKARKPNGSMLAVGLSPRDVEPYLTTTGDAVVVACINSPESVTLAGDKAALQDLEAHFKEQQIFCRMLQVENAYHSPQMFSVREEYKAQISDISPQSESSSVMFYSTVRGCRIPTAQLTADYWADNMCSTVLFLDALDDMLYADIESRQRKPKSETPSLILEIGPHGALAAPIKQFKVARGGMEDLSYHSLLSRGQDATVTSMGAAGSLWARGVPVKLNMVNNVGEFSNVLTNAPSYQWNHSASYWHESRQSRNHRFPEFPRHDLIGMRLDTCNPLEPVWKNHLRVSELPWLQDHRIHGDIVFPAAGMICSFIEAAKQVAHSEGSSHVVSGFELRELSVTKALVIPNNDTGTEVHVCLKRRKVGMDDAGPWFECSYYSCQEDDVFVQHAAGLLQIERSKEAAAVDRGKEEREEILAFQKRWDSQRAMCEKPVTRSSHYKFCEDQGLCFGKTFQGLTKVRQKESTVAFEIKIADTRACMPEFRESDYVVHPATLDAVLQAMMVVVPRMDGIESQLWVPTGAASMRISNDISRAHGAVLQGVAESSHTGVREMTGSLLVRDGRQGTLPAIIMNDFKFSGLGTAQKSPSQSDGSLSTLYASVTWKPDLSLVDDQSLRSMVVRDHQGEAANMVQFCSEAYSLVNQLCRLALPKLDCSSTSLPPHLRKYAAWVRNRCSYKKAGIVTPSVTADVPSPPNGSLSEPENVAAFICKYPVDGTLLLHAFHSLGAIFAQEKSPLAALMEADNFSQAYQAAYGLHINTQLFQHWFDLKAHKQPTLRVIEIGAGTASTTLPVLQRLGPRRSETPRFSQWTFTDISPGYFENAMKVLQDWKGRVEYKVLDIDNDPTEQGFDAESYDVVLAVNVLHATKDINRALKHCKKLLKPGGNLVLGEYTNPDDLCHFVFGILPGWWAAEDGRENSPLLSQSQWHDALQIAGFSGADVCLADNDDPTAHRMSTIVSTKPRERIPLRDVIVVVMVSSSGLTKSLASDVCRRFQRLGHRATVKDVAAAVADASGKTVIALLEYDEPFLGKAQQVEFEHAKHLLLHSRETLWVTRSDLADMPGHPANRIVSGLMRCLKTEDSSRRLYELHFSRPLDGDVETAGVAVCQRLCTIWDADGDGGTLDEMETAERDGAFCIPRYTPDRTMNDSIARATRSVVTPEVGSLVQAGRPLKMTIGQPGMLDTLHFVDDDDGPLLRPLLDEEVEIEVRACGLNFLDIMVAMGQIPRLLFGHEAAGIVRRVGSKSTKFSPGDRVVYIGQGAMRTCIRCHESSAHRLPDAVSLVEGASIPIVYATAYQSLIEVARLQKGESVLIHAAAGGLGQALIQIAKLLDADIFCTVGTELKKQAIVALGVQPDRIFSSRDVSFAKGIRRMTDGRGVDVVVNSLAGEALRQSWHCLASHGRFIEVGKKDMLCNNGLDMQPFLNNAMFAGVNLEAMTVNEPLRCSRLMSKVLKLFEQGAIGSIRPIAVHEFSKVESVFREMQRGSHIGKLVLRVTPESKVLVAPRKSALLRLKPNVTYLLVGGLGGLGRAQALFMAEHGARHLAFISRSGAARAEAEMTVAKLVDSGVEVRVYAGDVADDARLREIIDDISHSMPPVKGVIQGAMVLADSLFHRMSYDQWVAATRPKAQGSWNLHKLLPNDLDFFILLSSLAGIIGSVSQANYAAGNTFQDALVHYRRQRGLAAQSIDLGVIKGIGYVEEHHDSGAWRSPLRLTGVDEQRFIHTLRCALDGTADGVNSLAPQLLVGAGSGGVQQASRKSDPSAGFYWLRSLPHFAYLRQVDVKDTDDAGDNDDEVGESRDIRLLKLCKSMDEAIEAVQKILVAKIARIISIPVADINTTKPVYTYGVDSLVAVELRNWLSMELRSDLSIFDLTSSAPISDVSRKIAGRSQLVPAVVKS